jgi:HlyD family secretion protein
LPNKDLRRAVGWHEACSTWRMDIRREDLKIKKRRRQIAIGAAVVVALLAASVGVARLKPAAPRVERASVWLDTVKRGEMLREVRGPGTLVPKEIRWITAETNAHVERIVVKPGAQVTADTVVLELSNPEVQEQLASAASAVSAARADNAAKKMSLENQLLDQKANFAQVQSDYESSRLEAEAKKDLAQKGVIPQIQYKQIELTAVQRKVRMEIETERMKKFGETVNAQIDADKARLSQLETTLALRKRQAEALALKAGIAGVLQQVPVQEGQQVTAGTNLARVARPDVLRAELHIAETQAKDVVIGQGVKVDTRNGIAEGKVERIDPAVQNGTVQVDVDLQGDLPPGARPDLSVEGTIQIERLENVVYVGRPAFGQPNSDVRLFKLNPADGIAERIPVRLGRSSVNLIEITRGLNPGDQVVLSDTSAWDAYDRIRLN